MLTLLLLAQASPDPSVMRFSILADPCASARKGTGDDVVVCGRVEAIAPRLPLPQYRGAPDHPAPSNPDLRASVALNGPAANAAECGRYDENCPGYASGESLGELATRAAGLVGKLFSKAPDKRGRVAIDLEDSPMPAEARVRP